MKLIAIGHYARVGKDSLANYIQAECFQLDPQFRVIKVSWAYKLKWIAYELYGWAGLREPDFYETVEGALLREVPLPALGLSPRQIWVKLGTDAVRENVYEHTWRDYLLKTDHQADAALITDTRFYNEIQGVEEAGGHRVKVVRPGFGPGPNKPDRELLPYKGWNNTVGETGSLIDLQAWAHKYALWLLGRGPEPRRTREEQEEAAKVEVITPWEPIPILRESYLQMNPELLEAIRFCGRLAVNEGFDVDGTLVLNACEETFEA